jgi:hypothetical protein
MGLLFLLVPHPDHFGVCGPHRPGNRRLQQCLVMPLVSLSNSLSFPLLLLLLQAH